MRDEILQIILNSVTDISHTLEEPISMEQGEDCPLFGDSSMLDSITLVTLIVKIEQEIEDRFVVPIILASEKAMSRRNSPFLNIGTLTNYTLELVKEGQKCPAQ